MKRILFLLTLLLGIFQAKSQTLVTAVEAETGVLSGVTIAGPEGASSGQFVTGFDRSGDKLTVTVNVPSAGIYNLVIRYRSVFGDKTNDLYINGAFSSGVVFFTATDFVDLAPLGVVLNAGSNTIEVQKNWGYIDVDKFSIQSKAPNVYNITSSLNDNQITTNAQKLYDFVRSQYGQKIMTGQTSDYYDNVVSLVGKKPLVRGFDLLTYSPMYAYAWDGGHVFGAVDNGEVDKVINWYSETGKKGVVEIHWHWFSPSGGEAGTNTFYTSETTFDVSKAVISGTQENIDALRDIDAIAVQLKKIRDAGVPVIWRPLHEAGGGWFWWGAKGPGPCLALWDILRDRLTNYHGLHNLIWSWSTPETNWYPGHSKVDMLGFDSYPGPYNYTIQKAMFDTFHNLGEGTKIVAMTENGPIPDLGQAIDFDARWSWFCAWNDMVTSENTTQHIIDMYNHPYALTVENCPSYQTLSVETPVFNPASGTYTQPVAVSISTTTTGSTIYYTIDGSTPTTSSTIYSSPITISSTTTVKAMATKSGLDNSSVASATYTFTSSGLQIGGIYQFTARHSNKVMEVTASSLANGAIVQQYSNANTDNQKWKLVDGGSGTFKLVALHSGKALEVSGSSTAEGASIVQWDILSNQSQKWNIVSLGTGYYKIENINSGKALGVDAARKNNGTDIKQFAYTGATNQQWKVELVTPSSTTTSVARDGQEEVTNDATVSIYPNPANGQINIDLTNFQNHQVKIDLQDFAGRRLLTTQVSGGGIYVIKTSGYVRGYYIVKVEGKGERIFKKFFLK